MKTLWMLPVSELPVPNLHLAHPYWKDRVEHGIINQLWYVRDTNLLYQTGAGHVFTRSLKHYYISPVLKFHLLKVSRIFSIKSYSSNTKPFVVFCHFIYNISLMLSVSFICGYVEFSLNMQNLLAHEQLHSLNVVKQTGMQWYS